MARDLETSPVADARDPVVDPVTLTRKDLQEELQAFAQNRLVQCLREAFADQLDTFASKVSKQINSGSENFIRQITTDSDDASILPFPGKAREERKLATSSQLTPIPGAPRQPRIDGVDTFGFETVLTPSRKYEADVLARSRSKAQQHNTQRDVGNQSSQRTPLNTSHSDHEELGRMLTRVSIESAEQSQSRLCLSKLRACVESALFEQISGLMVILNAVSLGYATNHMATYPGARPDAIMDVSEPFFCVIFTMELLLRIFAFRSEFLTMKCWKWNIFDACQVSTQLLEQTLILTSRSERHKLNFGIFRILRLLRVIRIARLFRAFHLFDDLRVIVSSVTSSISSLGWSMVLLLILIYVFSVLFLQSIVSAGHTAHHEKIHYYFSDLFRTCLTMFECVVGGVSWDDVISPLMKDISPWLALLFCLYISACLFAMMNLLTGVFVDKAMCSVREDKDFILAKRIRDLFMKRKHYDDEADGQPINDEITWEVFRQRLESKAMQEYFQQINVEISEAHALFELMDEDESGSLTSQEIVRACLRLRGPARSLDMAIMSKKIHQIHRQVDAIEENVEHQLFLQSKQAIMTRPSSPSRIRQLQ